ncbi:mitochondrial alpha-ketoglutarate dehydrogenase Ymr31/Kgd4 [Schizosaccharomyces osmophilus]|uniref:Mitochondrial alpha-ketoglutarate dehydrogenase Ymr31/Kgd4 n=1 Tax=Schizosaccharomyces osmophilus TaxID=2545709 RepID=A0AAE9W907_9SCHI|nr:mitochondrial alpha-ketoglutarate dehydrogenase Ymr31/Kgd4 [Schizosaccharomyces osmophilus]WBW71530.1 mitochondrial alpha-ketoglutarate dehydrogenase Ymr31/Kgd4 [Schizosaccharomyces osmophilus]
MARKALIQFVKHLTKSSAERRPHPAVPFALPSSFFSKAGAPSNDSFGSQDVFIANDRNELSPRFHRMPLSDLEMSIIESGGASVY